MYLLAFLIGLAVGALINHRVSRVKLGIYSYQLKRALKQAESFNNDAKLALEKIQYEQEVESAEAKRQKKILKDRKAVGDFLATIPD